MTQLRGRAAEAYGEVAALFARAEALRDNAFGHGWDALAEGLQTCSEALDAAVAQLAEALDAISEAADPLETAMPQPPGLTEVASVLTAAHERLTDAALALHSAAEYLEEARNWAELTDFEVLAGQIEQVRDEIEELHQDTETWAEQVRADLGLAREESGPAPDEQSASSPSQNPPGCTGLPGTDLLDPRRFAQEPDPDEGEEAVRSYARIIDAVDDVPRIAQVLDVPVAVIATVKRHFFLTRHVIASGPGRTVSGYFTPELDRGRVWELVAGGRPVPPQVVERFRNFVAHEYVEARLMGMGMPYRSSHPDCYDNVIGGNVATPRHFGAHDIAPHAHKDNNFAHWATWGSNRPPPGSPGDLRRVDEIVEAAVKLAKEAGRDIR